MRTRIILLLLNLLGSLPLRLNQAVGAFIGVQIWRFHQRSRNITLRNLELCYPDFSDAQRRQLARESCISLGQTLFESPSLWTMKAGEIRALLDNPTVLNEILEIYQQGNGLVVANPHLGSWEYVGQLLAQYTDMTNLYRPPRLSGIDQWLRNARANTGAKLVPTDASGIKALSKALANGNCTGILPDQEPAWGNGIFIDFFHQQAYTMQLLPRLVRKRKVPVCFLFAERLPKGKFRLHCNWGEDALYHPDPAIACRCMNEQLESLIQIQPRQYNWAYKRFKKRPVHSPRLY